MPKCVHILQSWDTAYSEKDLERNSYSARTSWGIFQDEQSERFCMIMLDAWRARVDYPDLRREAKRSYDEHEADRVLIEKKASGQSLIQDLRRAGVPVSTYQPDRDKVSRAYAVQAMLESGQIYYPDRRWAQGVIDECALFPHGDYSDWVDTCTQAWLWLRNGWWLGNHPDDPEDDEPPRDNERRLYG
jgi:predicted phage terminase large subunit-like protein